MEGINSDIIAHMFAALQSMEKCMQTVQEAVCANKGEYEQLEHLVPQQLQVLTQMRRTANKLQLQFARSEWDEVIRSMKIFYGLNHMVRTDILTMYGIVTSNKRSHHAVKKLQSSRLESCH